MACTGWRAAAMELEVLWLRLLAEHHPSAVPVLFERWFMEGDCARPRHLAKKVRPIIETFGLEETKAALEYMLTRWAEIRARFSRAPLLPTVGYFFAIAPFLVRHHYEAKDMAKLSTELAAFGEANPFDSPPDALVDRLRLVTTAVSYPRRPDGVPRRRRRRSPYAR